MARTQGAKDRRPRKKPIKKFIRKTPAVPSAARKEPGAVALPAAPTPERVDPHDFDGAIQAAINDGVGVEHTPAGGPAIPPVDSASGPVPADSSLPPGFDPQSVSIEAWQAIWELPFWIIGKVLKLARVIPDSGPIERAGKRRAKDLAKPSYALWQHYSAQYAGLDPLNPLHLSMGATGLVGLTCIKDLGEAIAEARQIRPEQPAPTAATVASVAAAMNPNRS